MFKKRVFSLLIVTLVTLLTLLLALTLTGCRKGEVSENVDVTADVVVKEEKQVELLNEPRWVTADAGLRMRDSAGSSGNKIGLIPNGAQVTLLLEEGDEETIAGASGRWSKVKWQEQEGWVFGGFLSTEQPVVEEESVDDESESSGKTILIDGKEFDESVLYGLYLIEIKGLIYQIIELLPGYEQISYELIDKYHKTIETDDLYYGFSEEYISMLERVDDLDEILRHIATDHWLYDSETSTLGILFFTEYGYLRNYEVDIRVVIETESLKYYIEHSNYKALENYSEDEIRILKIAR